MQSLRKLNIDQGFEPILSCMQSHHYHTIAYNKSVFRVKPGLGKGSRVSAFLVSKASGWKYLLHLSYPVALPAYIGN